mmetsp:Transcript_94166/g.269928  ORF Transcript_94166/g.269928 Transcript_94166/m.269928 type:complete len:114 (-) Transcript_94166:131-472(-)
MCFCLHPSPGPRCSASAKLVASATQTSTSTTHWAEGLNLAFPWCRRFEEVFPLGKETFLSTSRELSCRHVVGAQLQDKFMGICWLSCRMLHELVQCSGEFIRLQVPTLEMAST